MIILVPIDAENNQLANELNDFLNILFDPT